MSYLFFSVLSVITCIYLYKKVPIPDNKFLVFVFLGSMVIRCYFAVLLSHLAYMYNADHAGFISGDDRLYSLTALEILRNIKEGAYIYRILWFGMNLYTYILATFYWIFGFKLIASKFINCYIGAIIPIVTYFTIIRFFNDRFVAKVASVICALYPSLIFWSTHNLKEPLIILSVLIGIYMLLKIFSRELKIWDIGILILYSFMILNLQLMYVYQIGIIILAIFFCYTSKPVKIIIPIILTPLFLFVFWKENFLLRFILFADTHQWNMAIADKAGYHTFTADFIKSIIGGHFNFLAFISIYLKGFVYFLFSPFPWKIESLTQLFALPQTLFWYVLLILFIVGIAKLFRDRPARALTIFIFLFIGISLWVFTEGNIGAAFRHRDHFAIIIFIFAAGGIKHFLDYLKQLKES